MKIGFLTDGKLNSFAKNAPQSGAELYCFAFGSIGEVNYEREVNGDGFELEDVAFFSKNFNCCAVVGCYTDTKGIKRKSAVIADRGRILGVSDATSSFDGDKYKCGAGIRVYDTSVGKVGVLVGRDIYFPDLVKSLAQCGAETVVCAYEHVGDNLEQILLRADAFRYGISFIMTSHGYAQIADAGGSLAFASPLSVSYCETAPVKEYHLVETRRRGFYRPQNVF